MTLYTYITGNELNQVIELVHLQEIIADLSQGLETLFVDFGMVLPEDQRQRVAITSAMIKIDKL